MKKFFLFLLLLIVVAGVAGFSYLKLILPDTGPVPELKVAATPARLERGKYLVVHVIGCTGCHSIRDINTFAGPIIPGTEGAGGEAFDQKAGFPGSYIAKNITPAHLGSWTDGELFKTITTGVNKDGKALFPIMPYLAYGTLDREDIYAVIAYIRTLKPIENEIPDSKSDFPMSLIINTIPQKAHFTTIPAKTDTVAYGRYLVTAAACTDCHTPQEKGQKIEGMDFSGGMKFNTFPDMTIQSANITPDNATGIGKWTEQQFVSKFKSYDPATHSYQKVGIGDMKTVMPWTMFAGMDTTDLKAIYQYLRTIKPVDHQIEKIVMNKAM